MCSPAATLQAFTEDSVKVVIKIAGRSGEENVRESGSAGEESTKKERNPR